MLDLPIAAEILRLGRHFEARLRVAFLKKIPRLNDRYFKSRLISDMTERSHSVQCLRMVPQLGGQFIRAGFELIFTTLAIAWIFPASAFIAILTSILSIALPLITNSYLAERNLRVRNHNGALSCFYLDALLGLVPIRTHGAERAIRREHEDLLIEWARAGLTLQKAVIAIEGLQAFLGFALSVWLLGNYLAIGGRMDGVLLLIYWALNLPTLGQTIASLARQYPNQRSIFVRLLEPLKAPEQDRNSEEMSLEKKDKVSFKENAPGQNGHQQSKGVSLFLKGVSVRRAGKPILEDIDLSIESGSHVAIVGPSGAGKSSLVGLFLGWHDPAKGRLLIDGGPLNNVVLERLRSATAWIDPSVQLWNKTFLENLCYGCTTNSSVPFSPIIKEAGLHKVIEKLPWGFQTPLGEGGALVSGGEGQRVRLGRAMFRPDVRLVILDEPFRGLEYKQRESLLSNSRKLWEQATLLCITHDIGQTLSFDQVVVLEEGHIVEMGVPEKLVQKQNSHFKKMLETENAVYEKIWGSACWRKLKLEEGHLTEMKKKVCK